MYTGNFHCQMTWDGNDSQDSVVTVLDLSSNGTYVGISGAAHFFFFDNSRQFRLAASRLESTVQES